MYNYVCPYNVNDNFVLLHPYVEREREREREGGGGESHLLVFSQLK
jgi:hypothetical protein